MCNEPVTSESIHIERCNPAHQITRQPKIRWQSLRLHSDESIPLWAWRPNNVNNNFNHNLISVPGRSSVSVRTDEREPPWLSVRQSHLHGVDECHCWKRQLLRTICLRLARQHLRYRSSGNALTPAMLSQRLDQVDELVAVLER